MTDVAELTVTQVRLYAPDVIPLQHLRTPVSAKTVKDVFQFEQVLVEEAGVAFQNGTFQHEQKPVIISRLLVEARKTQSTVIGTSSLADAAYNSFMELVRTLDHRESNVAYDPLIKTEETACVATLEIDYQRFLSPQFADFVQSWTSRKLVTPLAKPTSVGLRRLIFEVRFEPTTSLLSEHDITLANKQITIEPRVGTPWSQRRFFTVSPSDSQTHLLMLETLERNLSVPRE